MLAAIAPAGTFPNSQVRAPPGVAGVVEEPGYLSPGCLSVNGPVAGLLPGVGRLEVRHRRGAAENV